MSLSAFKRSALALPLSLALSLTVAAPAGMTIAATGPAAAPPVDFSAKPSNATSPFGFFKLVQCDGPEQASHVNPATGLIDLSKNPDGTYKYTDKSYVPCDFNGLMMEAQFLINAMIMLGVMAAIVSLAIAGAYYISGSQKNIAKAKEMFPKIAKGFIIMLTAWFIVYEILNLLTNNVAYLKGTVQ